MSEPPSLLLFFKPHSRNFLGLLWLNGDDFLIASANTRRARLQDRTKQAFFLSFYGWLAEATVDETALLA
jgi:hypothetical protein